MRFVGRGHPSVRATHAKTFEIGVDADITARASCVVAVAARHDALLPPAGPVVITLRVADFAPVTVHAAGNPLWDPRGPAVIRRSPLRLPNTLATEADVAAADLPRDLVAALARPETTVQLDVDAAAGAEPTVVLFAADPARPGDPALLAECAAADAVVAEDPDARRLVRDAGVDPVEAPDDTAVARTLVVATRDLPGTTAVALLADAGHRVETVGLPPALAAAAAIPSRAPLTLATHAKPRAALRDAPLGHRVVVRVDPADLAGFLAFAAELRGGAAVVAAQQFAPPQRLDADRAAPVTHDEELFCGLAPVAGDGSLDPAAAAAVRALLADGVPTRTAARALAALTGRPRREAYELTLALGTPVDDPPD